MHGFWSGAATAAAPTVAIIVNRVLAHRDAKENRQATERIEETVNGHSDALRAEIVDLKAQIANGVDSPP